MKRVDFYKELDQLLELAPGTVKGSESLEDLQVWDSLAVIGFLAMVDTRFGMVLSTEALAACRTVSDLEALVEGKLED